MRATMLTMVALLTACADGPQWQKTDTGVKASLRSVHGTSASDVWAVGDDGAALHFDGERWTKVASGTSSALTGVWAVSASDVWAVGSGRLVLRWNGASFQPVANVPATFESVMAVDANNVFFCGSSGLQLFSNGTFTELRRGNSAVSCQALFPLEGGVGALLADKEVHRLLPSGSSLLLTLSDSSSSRTVVAPSAGDVWVAGSYSGSVIRYGGATSRELVLPEDMSVSCGFARGPADVWLAGGNGYLAHFDGDALTLKVAGDYSAPELRSVWGFGGTTFAVGSGGWAMRLVEDAP